MSSLPSWLRLCHLCLSLTDSLALTATVTGILRWQPLVTLSRLTYGVYLVHFAVQLMQAGAERNPVHLSMITVVSPRSAVRSVPWRAPVPFIFI